VLPVGYEHRGGDRFRFYSTSDGGRTWVPGPPDRTSEWSGNGLPPLADAVNGRAAFELDPDGSDLFVSTDGRTTHVRPRGLPSSIWSIDFVNAEAGLAFGENTHCPGKKNCVIDSWFLRSTDGGRNWYPLAI
jgi:hypothetical protein